MEVESGGGANAKDGRKGGGQCRGVLVRYVTCWECEVGADITADPPIKDIHTFYGVLTLKSTDPGAVSEQSLPLNVENVLWANTVLAAGSAVGLVVYTGKETRAVLNTSEPETKMGTLEAEVNKMAKVSSFHKMYYGSDD